MFVDVVQALLVLVTALVRCCTVRLGRRWNITACVQRILQGITLLFGRQRAVPSSTSKFPTEAVPAVLISDLTVARLREELEERVGALATEAVELITAPAGGSKPTSCFTQAGSEPRLLVGSFLLCRTEGTAEVEVDRLTRVPLLKTLELRGDVVDHTTINNL